MLIGRLRNAGAKFCDLKKAFGHDNRTIKKWAEALKSNDIEIMTKAFAGRTRGRKLSPEIIRYAIQQYNLRKTLGHNYREIIIHKIKEVFKVEISRSLASLIFASATRIDLPQEVDDNLLSEECATDEDIGPFVNPEVERMVEKVSDTNQDIDDVSQNEKWSNTGDEFSCLTLKKEETVQQSTIFPETLKRPVDEKTLVHHLGLIFFSLWLRYYPLPERQFICQLLQGAVNIEASKLMCYQSLEYFCPKIVKVQQEQRKIFDEKSNLDSLIASYQRNKFLLSDGPGKGKEFFFDTHTKECTGQLKILKGWCGSKHGIAKVINLECFHTASGRPCFIQHYSPYYDMRERFFMSLKLFDLLFSEEERQGRTFIIDRGIYGIDTLKHFDKDYIITWEKGYKNGDDWIEGGETVHFKKKKKKNNKSDTITYEFDCQEREWSKLDSFRKIVVKARKYKKGKQQGKEVLVSIISSNPIMSVEKIVWLMFNRWLQENDFKYLDIYFGINQLDSRVYDSFEKEADKFKDRPIDSPEYKKLKGKLQNEESKFAKSLLRLRKTEAELEKLSVELKKQKAKIARRMKTKTIINMSEKEVAKDNKLKILKKELTKIENKQKNFLKKKKDIEVQISILEEKTEELSDQLNQEVRKKSRLQSLIDNHYQKINTKRKAYLDSQRVNAANQFRNLHDIFRIISNNYRDDHMKLRMLTRCSGFIHHSTDKIIINLWLPGNIQPHVIKNMQTFASIIETKINKEKKKENIKTISIKLLPGTIKVMQKNCI
jgi:hypothetical protein